MRDPDQTSQLRFSVMVQNGISARDKAKDERGGKRKGGEKEHLKCGNAESGRGDEVGDRAAPYSGVHD